MSLLDFNVFVIYIIQKILVLLKNPLNFLKVLFLNASLRCITDSQFILEIIFFSQHIIRESLSLREENLINDIRNLSRTKKNKIALQ